MAYTIDSEKCTACGSCAEVCSDNAIKLAGSAYKIDATLCAECGACAGACPNDAISAPSY